MNKSKPLDGNFARLTIDKLQVKYDHNIIIPKLDLEIKTGKITILVGANGCGKSTLLKTMARILKPSRGGVLLDGKNIHQTNTKQVAQKLGLLPQGPIAPEGLTVKELVSQGRFPHQSLLRQWTQKDEAAVAHAMQTARVDILPIYRSMICLAGNANAVGLPWRWRKKPTPFCWMNQQLFSILKFK